jgi:PAS domain S-box-containing protein
MVLKIVQRFNIATLADLYREDVVPNSPEVLQLIMASSTPGFIIIDAHGTVQSFSPGAERLFGYVESEVVGQHVSILMPESNRTLKGKDQSDHWGLGADQFDGVVRAVTGHRKDDTDFSMLLSTGEFERDGRPMFIATVHDLGDDVASRKALQESEGRFRQLVDNIEEVFILRTTAPYRYVYISPAVHKVFGLTADEAIANPELFLSFTHPDDLEFVRKTMAEAGSAPQVEVEYRIIRADGETRWVWTRYRHVDVEPGSPPLLAVVVSDITAQKDAQRAEVSARAEAERANAAKTEFLSRMSHELRTPLNAILGFAQLLNMDDLGENQRESVHQILRGGRHLLDLINEVLDISRIDSGQLALSPEPVLVSEVVGEVIDLVVPLVTARNLAIVAPSRDRCDEFVLADRQRFKQVLLNLVSNSIKYNREGGEITLTCAGRSDHTFALTVSDTGIGMGAEELERLFTPFDRLGRESTGEEGTGVGLALSQRLIHLMGGSIEVESATGVGSSFTIVLPLTRVAELPTDDRGSDEESARGVTTLTSVDPEGLTVVYIEDNLANVRLMEQLAARRRRVTLVHAMQGRLGLDLVASSRPGLILLDLHLPDMSGEEVLRRLQAEADTKDIPTVVVSADASLGQIRRVLELGASGYLTKPFDVEELLRWLDDPEGMKVGPA